MEENPKSGRSLFQQVLLVLGVMLVLGLLGIASDFLSFLRAMNGLR